MKRIYTSCISAAACLLVLLLITRVNFFRPSVKDKSSSMPSDSMVSENQEIVSDHAPGLSVSEECEEAVSAEENVMQSESILEVSGNVEEEKTADLLWENPEFIRTFHTDYETQESIQFGSENYILSKAVSNKSCDVTGLSKTIYNGYNVVFAYDSLTETCYAYYETQEEY